MNFCTELFDGYIILWFQKFFEILNADSLCFYMKFCNSPRIIPDKNKDFINRVLINRPPNDYKKYSKNSKKTIKFALVTDIHVDYYYKEVFFYAPTRKNRELSQNAEK